MESNREENFEKAWNDLNSDDKEELSGVAASLLEEQKRNGEPNLPIKDMVLKKRLARICLKIIDETVREELDIMETAYIIVGKFMWYNYGDSLNDALDIAGELELPAEHVDGDVFELWGKLRKIFEDYLVS